MHLIVDKAQMDLAVRFRQVYGTYQHNRDLISVGAYRRGSDPRIDQSIELFPRLQDFLRQDMYQPVGYADARSELSALLGNVTK